MHEHDPEVQVSASQQRWRVPESDAGVARVSRSRPRAGGSLLALCLGTYMVLASTTSPTPRPLWPRHRSIPGPRGLTAKIRERSWLRLPRPQMATVSPPATPLDPLAKQLKQLQCQLEAGAMSGIVQAVIFHPWDRALYLAQTNRRRFANVLNWKDPFQGLPATLALRILTASIFFPLEESITPVAEAVVGAGAFAHFAAGNIAGGVSAVALNPIQAVRYRTFSLVNSNALVKGARDTFFSTARDMARTGGVRPFLKGINPTLGRDLVFGGLFTLLRRSLAERFVDKTSDSAGFVRFACDVTAAAIATTCSSPYNYARNMLYASPSGVRPPRTLQLINTLLADAARRPTFALRARYLQQNLKIGAATFRVALSMALASTTYDLMKQRMGADGETQAKTS